VSSAASMSWLIAIAFGAAFSRTAIA